MYRPYGISARQPNIPPPMRGPQFSGRGLSLRTRLNIHRFLELGWHPEAIASREGCSRHAVSNVQNNLRNFGYFRKPLQGKLGALCKIQPTDGEALFEELMRTGWLYQDEIVYWLAIERGIYVSQSTVSRYLNKMNWSRRTLSPFSIDRNEDLRQSYRVRMSQYTQEDLVFLDESIFNEKSGWWHKAYGPVGHESRYTQDIQRGSTWAILPAYTSTHGYLPCTGIKGYYNHEQFIQWIQSQLIPTLRHFYGDRPMVIVLDNVSIHTNDNVRQVLESAGYLVQYLPPYSPDYNPIELTFSVLKAWIKGNYVYMRKRFGRNGFGAFLGAAIKESKCDQFAKKHFKYAGGGLYIEQDVLERVRRELREEFEFNWE